ncbi:MAG: potassium channel family protein [Candidatus Saccharibacteria bacterium]|nr:potassium channel family protein [Candidatus Saccharibacteria bacterium]
MFQNRFKIDVAAALSALAIMIGIGTVAYHFMEGWSWITSLYFVVATLATVGYGDVHPTNDATRLFTVIYILIGVTIAVSSLGVIGSHYLAKRQMKLMNRSPKNKETNG